MASVESEARALVADGAGEKIAACSNGRDIVRAWLGTRHGTGNIGNGESTPIASYACPDPDEANQGNNRGHWVENPSERSTVRLGPG